MHVIYGRNTHELLPEGLRLLSEHGQRQPSRAGDVLVMPTPVMTVYEKPVERVLFWPERNANPFFHILESCWMLAGRRDTPWLVRFNKRMAEYSDNGKIFHGAYGYRWRNHFRPDDMPFDQLEEVCGLLKNHPNSRRAVIQMWDCKVDLWANESRYKDVPCNTQIYVWRDVEDHRVSVGKVLSETEGEVEGEGFIPILNMTVMCRSNDIIWGAYGANAVHFSILQEYLAARLGWQVGKLYQFSNNYHAYVDIFEKNRSLIAHARDSYAGPRWNPYTSPEDHGNVITLPLVDKIENFDEELSLFMDDEEYPDLYLDVEPSNKIFHRVTLIKRAWFLYKEGDLDEAMREIEKLPPQWDFTAACWEWFERKVGR